MLRQTVHAFVSSAAADALIGRAFADRRLLKLELTRLAGGPSEARARYASEPSPPLLILEARASPERLLAELEALAEVCIAGTNLIVLGAVNDVGLYRELIRRGVADYLVLPADPVALIEAALTLCRDAGRYAGGQVFAFIGARGGCGSSTLAGNVAWGLARRGDADVVLLDLDLAFGGADLAFNLEAGHGVQAVLADPERIDDQFLGRFTAKYGERLHLLPTAATLEPEILVTAAALDEALTALRRQARFIVLDLPRCWTDWLRQTLHTADQVVVTALPDLVSVRNGRNLIDFLAARRRLDQPPLLALNRVGAARRGEIGVKDFAETIGLAPTVVIAEDGPGFSQAAAAGRMLEEASPRARAIEAIRQLSGRLGGDAAKPAASGGGGWLKRLTIKS
ncbi:MAG: cellulose synthase operon protein YhjQ/BcsQ [Rhodospirillaceae bacterium]